MIAAPSVRRRLVGGALRRYRESLGYTLDDAARMLHCDRSRISRIETGQRGIQTAELRRLLAGYGVEEEAQATLAAIADPRSWRGWWRAYVSVLPDAYQDYLMIEAAASRVLLYEAQRVPEVLQTPAYARALAAADPALTDDAARDQVIEATLARQKAVLGGSEAEIHVIIGEAALRQQVGGTAVMDGQLGLLAGVTGKSGRVTVQILPFGCGAHAAAGAGSLAIVQFTGTPDLGAVYLGGASGGACLEGARDVAVYARAFGQLKALALSSADSALLLRGREAA